jgi:hypothetical protein
VAQEVSVELSTVRDCWCLRWNDKSKLDGDRHHLMVGTLMPGSDYRLFATRQEAREYREKKYGYIRTREDLQREPHGWRMPSVIKVRVTIEEVGGDER